MLNTIIVFITAFPRVWRYGLVIRSTGYFPENWGSIQNIYSRSQFSVNPALGHLMIFFGFFRHLAYMLHRNTYSATIQKTKQNERNKNRKTSHIILFSYKPCAIFLRFRPSLKTFTSFVSLFLLLWFLSRKFQIKLCHIICNGIFFSSIWIFWCLLRFKIGIKDMSHSLKFKVPSKYEFSDVF